ncbi:Asp-tRNA(Asn)/Glu-tRNA(Gln) amidotransferase GatCAB subunit B, partial [Candidatus Falkowbacteria bacterium]|nr:Asp-tRNA(Asn)/Glu-tRNA(Gln) amidotransferase GatCAB subunit B [Candidatus Falkowbacteria bacterium]
AELICLIYQNKINSSAGQTLLEFMYNHGGDPSDIMKKMGLEQMDDVAALKKTIAKIISENKEQVEQYKKGKTNVIQFLLGKVMAETGGKANPKITKQLLEEALK